MKKSLLLIMLSFLLTAGCKKEAELPTPVEPSLEDLVIQNCYIVRDAAEAFAVQNGRYPSLVDEFASLLPNGEMLENPFQGYRTEPIDGPASFPGETGYQVARDGSGNTGYGISGYGESDIIITLSKQPGQ